MGEQTFSINGETCAPNEFSRGLQLIRAITPEVVAADATAITPKQIQGLSHDGNKSLDLDDVIQSTPDRSKLAGQIMRYKEAACFLKAYGVETTLNCESKGIGSYIEVNDEESAIAEMARIHLEDPEAKIVLVTGASWCESCRKFDSSFNTIVGDNNDPHVRIVHLFSTNEKYGEADALGRYGKSLPAFMLIDPVTFKPVKIAETNNDAYFLDILVDLGVKKRSPQDEKDFMYLQLGQNWSVVCIPAATRLLAMGEDPEKVLKPLLSRNNWKVVQFALERLLTMNPEKKSDYSDTAMGNDNSEIRRQVGTLLRERDEFMRMGLKPWDG